MNNLITGGGNKKIYQLEKSKEDKMVRMKLLDYSIELNRQKLRLEKVLLKVGKSDSLAVLKGKKVISGF